jgi:hypothetical protein
MIECLSCVQAHTNAVLNAGFASVLSGWCVEEICEYLQAVRFEQGKEQQAVSYRHLASYTVRPRLRF